MTGDTIVAVATAPGVAGVGVLRISGPEAFAGVAPLFQAADGRPLGVQPPRFLAFGRLQRPDGSLLDEVLVVRFVAPHSFTGEDVVEIQCHGGVFHLREIQVSLLECARAAGLPLRLAQPGEFTQRAFLNGKLDLTRAEAVADLIHSDSSLAREAAARQLGGGLKHAVEALRGQVLGLLAECEASCDFPEEQEQFGDAQAFDARLDVLVRDLDVLLGTARLGRAAIHGLRCALAGAPNAGKSSLLNAFCGEERAIVSAEPGTTRDWLEAQVQVQGLAVLLYDTAGLRQAAGVIEAEGVRRALSLAREADALLLVLDTSAPLDAVGLGLEALEGASGDLWLVLNKSDLPPVWSLADLGPVLRARGLVWSDAELGQRALSVSARTGEGLEILLERVVERALQGPATRILEQAVLTQARHERAAKDARANLERTRQGRAMGAGPELLAVDLRAALDALGEIVGATPRARVLEEIFSRFCIGK